MDFMDVSVKSAVRAAFLIERGGGEVPAVLKIAATDLVRDVMASAHEDANFLSVARVRLLDALVEEVDRALRGDAGETLCTPPLQRSLTTYPPP